MKKRKKRNNKGWRATAYGVALLLVMMSGCDNTTSPNQDLTNSYDKPVPMQSGEAMNTTIDELPIYTVEGFYFLAPMVKDSEYSGTFDAGLSPVVEICETTACTTIHESFDMDGEGSEQVRMEEDDEHYIVNWNTNSSGAEAGQTYRVRVLANGITLGHADVAVVTTGREAVEVRSDGLIALVANQTLPVKFRVETGIVGAVVVSPAEATIDVGETQQFSAALYDLHGEPLAGPAVVWSSGDTDVATVAVDGLATGVEEGSASITASAGHASGNGQLNVVNSGAEVDPVVDCSFDLSSGGDRIFRSFYVTEFPGTGFNSALLKMSSNTADEFGFTLTARQDTYDGPLLGVGTAEIALNGNTSENADVMFDYSGNVEVPQGTIVTFQIAKVSGASASIYYNTGAGSSNTCPVIQTNFTTPPLDTFRRNGVGVVLY